MDRNPVSTSDAWKAHMNNRLSPIARVAAQRSVDPSETTRAREAGFAELDEAMRSAQRIRSTINALAPICKLPSEVLTHIFVLLSEIYHPTTRKSSGFELARRTFRSTGTGETMLGWVFVLHVCRRWREVAVECSSLWASIEVILGATWAKRFLKLSRSHPVVIERPPASLHCYRVHEAIYEVIEHAPHRLVKLDIYNTTSSSLSADEVALLLSSMELQSFPQLRDLHLSSPRLMQIPLPRKIFTSVRHMTLADTTVSNHTDWTTFPCTFQSIKLVQQRQPFVAYIPSNTALRGLFAFLGRCTKLAVLEIHPTFLNFMPIDCKTCLPSLHSLSLYGRGSFMSIFLRSISSLPAIRNLMLRFDGYDHDDFRSVVFAVQGPEVKLGSVLCNDLSVIQRADHMRLEIKSIGAMPSEKTKTAPRSAVSLTFPFPSVGVNLTTTLLEPMDLSALQVLEVKGLLAPPGLWQRWFGAARQVRRLALETSDTLACVRTLGLPLPQPPSEQANPQDSEPSPDSMLFPSLQELSVRDADFTKVIAPALTPGDAAAVMKLTLTTRAYWRCVPRCLKIQSCVVDAREFERWMSVVPPDQRDWAAESLARGVCSCL